MISFLKNSIEAWRGSGSHAVTVPPMDGALKPNNAIEEASVLFEIAEPDNLVHDGSRVLFSSTNELRLLKAGPKSASTEVLESFPQSITALAARSDGSLAAGFEAGGIAIRGGRHGGKAFARLGDREALCPVALSFDDDEALLVALGSQNNPPSEWKRDLMQANSSGSVWRLDLVTGAATCLADGLAWPFGLLPSPDRGVVVAESWRNRLVRVKAGAVPQTVLADIAGYPARLAPMGTGDGAWLAAFAPRSQLIEFVLRERDYCDQMIREIDPRYWMAPALSPTQSLLEPMQLGGASQLGMVKPWAPTRSYGLLIGLDGHFEPRTSFHSRADGRRHGITSCVEYEGRLLATSKGGQAIVAVDLAKA